MKLFKRNPLTDKRHVPDMDPRAVLTAIMLTESVDYNLGHSSGFTAMGSWTDSDEAAFIACLTAKMDHATMTDHSQYDNYWEFLVESCEEIYA